MTAKVVPNAVVVPASSISTASDGTTSVMVVGADSRVNRQDVTTGIEDNGNVQVISGLKPGQEIVATGAYGLPNKTKINAKPLASSGNAS